MMEIQDVDYTVFFDEENNTLFMKGIIRLSSFRKYDEIKKLLLLSANKVKKELILDLQDLIYLNSSGITTVSTFVIYLRKENSIRLKVLGSKKYPWQERALGNLKKLWGDIIVIFE
ncbi:MAG: hypothetical protein AAF518_10350 [Spirochaetota bacterium]